MRAAGWIVSAAVVVATAGLLADVHAQNARLDALTREVAAARADLARASHATPNDATASLAPPVAPERPALEARDLDAIAARVEAARRASADTDTRLAAEASAPTADQLASREAVHRKIDAMIASGRVQRDVVAGIRRDLETDPDGRYQASLQLAVAINSGRLAPPEDPRDLMP